MTQLRQDPTTKEWVIIAAERSKRPRDFVGTKTLIENLLTRKTAPSAGATNISRPMSPWPTGAVARQIAKDGG